MQLQNVGLKPTMKNPQAPQKNEWAKEAVEEVNTTISELPDEIFKVTYTIDKVAYTISLRSLLEIDVSELSDLTLSNLRTSIEQIASIRFTLQRAYEQLVEEYELWKINFDIWLSGAQETSRNQYWNEQVATVELHKLAKSAMKAPSASDIKESLLRSVGLAEEYKMWQEKRIKFDKAISNYQSTEKILNGREFVLKTIIESR